MYKVPDYCKDTFDPQGDGFMFSSEPPANIADPSNLRANNPWEVVACALMRLRGGDFSVFPAIIDALERHDDMLLALSVGALFSYVAPGSALPLLERVYTREKLSQYPEMVRQYCKILCYSMMSHHLDIVLHWYRVTDEEWVRSSIPWYLSDIWDDEPGDISNGPQLVLDPQYPHPFEQYILDYPTWERKVREAAARVDPSARYVLGGAPFSVIGLAKRMLAHARAGEDSVRTNFERMVFEANTGISCKGFFTDAWPPKFRPLSAMAILEDFLEDPWRLHFADGQRYFFGHPVPD